MEAMKHSITRKIGNTTFIINIMQAESAHKSLNEKIRDLCIQSALEYGQLEQASEDQDSTSIA